MVARATVQPIEVTDVLTLASVDPQALDADARVDLIVALERVKVHLDALQQKALAAVVEATEDLGVAGEIARHEVGAALRLSPHTAAVRTRIAADLLGRLPDTWRALAAGRIYFWQAAAIAEAVADLPDEVASRVEARVLPRARTQTLSETKRALTRAVIAADPAGAEARHGRARAQRRADYQPLPDAMAQLSMTMPAQQADQVWAGLSAAARAQQRTLRARVGRGGSVRLRGAPCECRAGRPAHPAAPGRAPR